MLLLSIKMHHAQLLQHTCYIATPNFWPNQMWSAIDIVQLHRMRQVHSHQISCISSMKISLNANQATITPHRPFMNLVSYCAVPGTYAAAASTVVVAANDTIAVASRGAEPASGTAAAAAAFSTWQSWECPLVQSVRCMQTTTGILCLLGEHG